jgi:DNA-directed RNA polymerase specialized sigma24 family protein
MVDRETIKYILREWGRWQQTAKTPALTYAISQMDTPLQKKRDVKPLYVSEIAEKVDRLMLKYLPPDYITVLELTYVDKTINSIAADILKCSEKTFTIKRNEAISMLQGIYTVIRDYE